MLFMCVNKVGKNILKLNKNQKLKRIFKEKIKYSEILY